MLVLLVSKLLVCLAYSLYLLGPAFLPTQLEREKLEKRNKKTASFNAQVKLIDMNAGNNFA